VALPGNQAETEKTNISLQHLEEPVYSTIIPTQLSIEYGVPRTHTERVVEGGHKDEIEEMIKQ